jgi:hypothetical protein
LPNDPASAGDCAPLVLTSPLRGAIITGHAARYLIIRWRSTKPTAELRRPCLRVLAHRPPSGYRPDPGAASPAPGLLADDPASAPPGRWPVSAKEAPGRARWFAPVRGAT